jgi:hypothetical protein
LGDVVTKFNEKRYNLEMEGTPNNIEKIIDVLQLKEFAKQVADLYVQAAGSYLSEDDPLRNRILDYYSNRPETEEELLTYLGKKNEQEIADYIKAVELFTKDPVRFIEKTEKLYELQDVHSRRGESQKSTRLATDEEYELGAYVDVLEWQVKDSVLVLQKKGYVTFQSGFRENNERDQFMDFYNKNVNFPSDAVDYLNKKQIEINVEHHDDRTTICLHVTGNQVVRLREWKEIWDYITNTLPQADKDMVDKINITGEHSDFRLKQDVLRKDK